MFRGSGGWMDGWIKHTHNASGHSYYPTEAQTVSVELGATAPVVAHETRIEVITSYVTKIKKAETRISIE